MTDKPEKKPTAKAPAADKPVIRRLAIVEDGKVISDPDVAFGRFEVTGERQGVGASIFTLKTHVPVRGAPVIDEGAEYVPLPTELTIEAASTSRLFKVGEVIEVTFRFPSLD